MAVRSFFTLIWSLIQTKEQFSAFVHSNYANKYTLKAAFLFKCAQFTGWPQSTFANPQYSFEMCVLCQNLFGHFLDDVFLDRRIAGRSVIVERLKDKSEVRLYQMVFVSPSEGVHLAEILESLRGASALVVGETAGFAASGGIIELSLCDNHVGFTINTDAADRAGLRFRATLLGLAKILHDVEHRASN